MFFSIFMPTLLELEVYRFVCDFILFMIRAKRTTCARQNSLDWIGMDAVVSAYVNCFKTLAVCVFTALESLSEAILIPNV